MTILGAHELNRIIPGLKRRLETDHFLLHYGLRNSPNGKGLGHHGVRGVEIVEAYAEALEKAYRTMKNEPWNRPDPIRNGAGRTPVFIYSVPDPVTIPYRFQIPAIILPPGNNGLTVEQEIERAMAMAVHEVAHVFNFREHLMTETAGKRWAWYDEGFAICLEEWVLPENRDRRRFLMNWINSPEIPLDSREAVYQAAMFVRYLSIRFGREFVNDVWTKSGREESPFAAIERLAPDGATFADVFSDYCRDAYFLCDPVSHCFERAIQERFGDRALAESFEAVPNSQGRSTSELDHLACRYFRFSIKPESRKLTIHLQTASPLESSPLKAELAAVDSASARIACQSFRPLVSLHPNEHARLICEMTTQGADKIDHIILIVTNCGLRPEPANTHLPHDDGQRFSVEFSAE